MGCSCLPLTRELAKFACFREITSRAEAYNKFTSINGRVECLKHTIMAAGFTIVGPVYAAINCIPRYQEEQSNPLDLLIAIVTAPIFFLLLTLRSLLGALIHPAIVYRTPTSAKPPTFHEQELQAQPLPLPRA